MLDYFSNLMKDVSDFSRNLTRVFHDIVLANMEVDCLQWSDRDKLDRICRTLMLKDTVPQVNLIASKALLARKKKKLGSKRKTIQENNCSFASHHRTAGQIYKHVCEYCDGLHVSRSYGKKLGSKLSG